MPKGKSWNVIPRAVDMVVESNLAGRRFSEDIITRRLEPGGVLVYPRIGNVLLDKRATLNPDGDVF